MKALSTEELKQIQIEILDYVVQVCTEYNLKYCLNYGTLIGAIRHKGFIPWDDDIDISMLRKDYDKLIEVTQQSVNPRFKMECVELNKNCPYSIGKMIDTTTVLYEMGENGIKTGVYIDIFVYDDAPVDEKERNKAFDKLDFYGRLRRYQLPLGDARLSLKRIGVLLIRNIIKLTPNCNFARRIVDAAKKYKNLNTGLVFDITDPYYLKRWCVEKSVFEELTDVEFEGKKFKAPKQYDKWLRMQYGDYMQIPSKEQQEAAKHKIKAYKIIG